MLTSISNVRATVDRANHTGYYSLIDIVVSAGLGGQNRLCVGLLSLSLSFNDLDLGDGVDGLLPREYHGSSHSHG